MLPDGTTRSDSKAFSGIFHYFFLNFGVRWRFSCCDHRHHLSRFNALCSTHTHNTMGSTLQSTLLLLSNCSCCCCCLAAIFLLSLSLVMSAPFFHVRLTPNGKRSLWAGRGGYVVELAFVHFSHTALGTGFRCCCCRCFCLCCAFPFTLLFRARECNSPHAGCLLLSLYLSLSLSSSVQVAFAHVFPPLLSLFHLPFIPLSLSLFYEAVI